MLKLINMQDRKISKSKLKICYIVTKGNWGGVQKYVYSLATNLPKDKYDVVVITGLGGILKRKLEEKGIKTYEISNMKRDISFLSEAKSFFQIFNIIRKESPDILHLNSPKASGIGSVVGRILLIPKIIQTVHGWTFNENRNIFSRALIYLFSWITVSLCTKTIVISLSERAQGLKMPFVEEKEIVLIRNGIEKIKFIEKSIIREAILQRLPSLAPETRNLISKSVWIGTIAELHPNKGLKYTLDALSKIKSQFVFFIIGEGEERKKLEEIIVEKGLINKVFLLGFIDIANLYLKAFDIFSLTSLKEGLPYTLLEAGQAGIALISSDIGGIPDIIDDGKNGMLCRKKDVKEIALDIEYLISNSKVRSEFGKRIKEKIDKEFSIDGMIKKTEKLYR